MERKQIIMTTMDVLMYVCMFVLMQLIGSLLQLVGATPAVSVAFYDVLIVGLFLLCKWSSLSLRRIKSHKASSMLWTLLLGLALVLPAAWVADLLGAEIPKEQEQLLLVLLSTPLGAMGIFLFAPFVEELVFRGAILRRLKTVTMWKGWLAIGISALLFAIVHGNMAQGVHAFAIGLLMGWLYMKTDSILLGMIIHLVNNTAAYCAYLYTGNPDATLEQMFGGNTTIMYAGVVVSVVVAVLCIYKLATNKLTK